MRESNRTARPRPRSPLLLLLASFLVAGCNNNNPRTTVNNNPPLPGIQLADAKKRIQRAYSKSYEETLEDRGPGRRKNRKLRKKRRRWLRKVRREMASEILGEESKRYDELVEAWEDAHPGETFSCDGGDDEAEKDGDEDTFSGELRCWARLCPSLANLLEGRQEGLRRKGDESWLADQEAPAPEDVDLEEIGVELPKKGELTRPQLRELVQEARAKGEADAEEALDELGEARIEMKKETRAKMRKELEGQVEESLEDCGETQEGVGDCESDEEEGEEGCSEQDGVPAEDSATGSPKSASTSDEESEDDPEEPAPEIPDPKLPDMALPDLPMP